MHYNLIISCNKSNLEKIRSFLDEKLHNHDIPDIEIYKMILAIDEVCANLIIHANNCNPSEKLELAIEVKPEVEVIFIIKDHGIGFDINRYKEPELNEIVSTKRKGGLGLMLVKRIMDKIEFSTEKNYNICTLVKNL
jgi:serine/threonine-protein kinase RsbW